MLASARMSVKEWRNFREDFVAEPDFIARIKDQPLRRNRALLEYVPP